MFDKKFMAGLPEEADEAAPHISRHFLRVHQLNESGRTFDFNSYLEALALAEAFIESHGLDHPTIPVISYEEGATGQNIARIVQFFNIWNKELRKTSYKKTHESSKARFAEFFGKRGLYEFSDNDF